MDYQSFPREAASGRRAVAWLAPVSLLALVMLGAFLIPLKGAHQDLASGITSASMHKTRCNIPMNMDRAHRTPNLRTAAQKSPVWLQQLGKGATTLSLAGAMSMGAPLHSIATEFDVLDAAKPTNEYIMDDAPVLQKGSEKKMNEDLAYLDVGKGFKLNVVTVRKLEESADAETLGQTMLEKWSGKDKSNSAVLVLVSKGYETALVGGDNFMSALGQSKAYSISQETVSYFASEGRPNQGISEGVKRITAILNGREDPGSPVIKEYKRERTYKTKEEVDASKGASIQVVGALLLIAFVVPMLQYAGYVQRD